MTRHYWWNAAIASMISWPLCEAIAWIENWSAAPAMVYAFLLSYGITMIVGIWRRDPS